MKLDQSVFDNVSSAHRWAARDANGNIKVFRKTPNIHPSEPGWWTKGLAHEYIEGYAGEEPQWDGVEEFPGWRDSLTERVVNMVPPEPAPWDVVTTPIDDGPHLSAEEIAETLRPIPPPQFGGEFSPAPEPVGPTISDMVESGHLVNPAAELLYEAERAKLKLQKARKRAAAAVADGEMSIAVFREIFG